jgi:rhodanese-related sulfurtransferase
METITREELQHLLDQDAVTLVEALPKVQYDAGHLPHALNLPGTTLTPQDAERLAPDRTRTLVTYCSGQGCPRSKVAAGAFTRLGYEDVRVYTGGKADWYDAGLPFETVPNFGPAPAEPRGRTPVSVRG